MRSRQIQLLLNPAALLQESLAKDKAFSCGKLAWVSYSTTESPPIFCSLRLVLEEL